MNKRQSLIRVLASKSDSEITFTVLLFTLVGVLTGIIPLNPLLFGLHFGLWFPLCCFIFMNITDLCREVVELQQRLEKLEKKLIP